MQPPRSVVLVVEDDPVVSSTLQTLLEAQGYEVEQVVDGSAAIARIQSREVDLMLLDLMLPGVDGLEVCRWVRARESGIYLPIIMLTANADTAQQRLGFAAGADDYVTKPFDADDLLDRVQVWARTRERLRSLHERLRREEEALQQTRLQQRLIIEAVNDAFLAMDAQGRITDWNHQAEVTFGLSRAEAIGRPLAELIVPSEFREPYERLTQHLLTLHEGPLVHRRVECTMLDRHGQARPMELTLWPVRVGKGYSFNAFARDLSERKQAEEELLGDVVEQRQAQRMETIGRLAMGIAHDFNNLLTVINGFSLLLLEQLDAADPRHAYVEQIVGAGDRAAALTNQLLDFSRRPARIELIDLNAVVAEVEQLLRRLIGENIDLLTIPCATPAQVRADRGQLEQILLNLVVNARDAMPEGGKLTIEVATVEVDPPDESYQRPLPSGSYALLTVSDNGLGMDPAIRARIFDPFFSTKERGKGTGLGLSIVARIVGENGGSISVASEPGQGSTFRIYLPRVEAPTETLAPPALASRPRGSETILLVEDEERIRSLAREVLEDGGYTVLEASDADEAVRRLEQHPGPIHLLVTDVVLPRTSGTALVERLAARRPDLRVLYMSGYPDQAPLQPPTPDAPVVLLPKPFSPDTLATTVRQVLDAPRPARR